MASIEAVVRQLHAAVEKIDRACEALEPGCVERVELVVNNEVCGGIRSCERMLPFILGPGQTLVVHDPVRTREFRGRDAR